MTTKHTLQSSDNLLICAACGTQYDTDLPPSTSPSSTFVPASDSPLSSCRICDDPRQYVPPSGQTFTTLQRLRQSGEYRNQIQQHSVDGQLWEIWTEGKVSLQCTIQWRATVKRMCRLMLRWFLGWDWAEGYLDSDSAGECTLGSSCVFGSGDCGQGMWTV